MPWWRIGPTALRTVLNTATPMAPPSWRWELNRVDALPVDAEEMVANAAACMLTITNGIEKPSANISRRIHHRLVWAPDRDMSAVKQAMPLRPPAINREGPNLGYNSRLTAWAPTITPRASGNVPRAQSLPG